jgi:hypothetical protein
MQHRAMKRAAVLQQRRLLLLLVGTSGTGVTVPRQVVLAMTHSSRAAGGMVGVGVLRQGITQGIVTGHMGVAIQQGTTASKVAMQGSQAAMAAATKVNLAATAASLTAMLPRSTISSTISSQTSSTASSQTSSIVSSAASSTASSTPSHLTLLASQQQQQVQLWDHRMVGPTPESPLQVGAATAAAQQHTDHQQQQQAVTRGCHSQYGPCHPLLHPHMHQGLTAVCSTSGRGDHLLTWACRAGRGLECLSRDLYSRVHSCMLRAPHVSRIGRQWVEGM